MKERIILAVDTSEINEAERLIQTAKDSGARYIKMGLELGSAIGWRLCSELASEADIGWVADAKLCDIPNTVVQTVGNFTRYDHPPFGITMHATSGREAMRLAQDVAGDIKMLGVTILTSFSEGEVEEMFYGVPFGAKKETPGNALTEAKVLQLAKIAAESGLKGLVCSPLEVGIIKADPATKHLFAMVPGTRSPGADIHDQSRRATPAEAIYDGADLLVIGRQITKADSPSLAYDELVGELVGAVHRTGH